MSNILIRSTAGDTASPDELQAQNGDNAKASANGNPTSPFGPSPKGIPDPVWTAYNLGISVLPPRMDGSKAPCTIRVGNSWKWEPFQEKRAEVPLLKAWYAKGNVTGIGAVCGKISGGRDGLSLNVLDFDDGEVYERYREAAAAVGLGEVLERAESGCSEATPSGGRHVVVRVGVAPGAKWPTEKLALRLLPPDAKGRPQYKTLIETKCEGGYIVLAPSDGKTHPTGKPYVQLRGGLDTIAELTPEEWDALCGLAHTFNEAPPPAAREPKSNNRQDTGRVLPGDDFNARASWDDLLEEAGYVHVHDRGEVRYYRRAGKDLGVSASLNYGGSDRFYCWSTSTELESKKSYSKFGFFARTKHGDDFKAAAKALGEAGYGSKAARKATGAIPRPDTPTVDVEATQTKVAAYIGGKDAVGLMGDEPLIIALAVLSVTDPGRFLAIKTALKNLRSLSIKDFMARMAPYVPKPTQGEDDDPGFLPRGVAEDDPHRLANIFLAEHQHPDGCKVVFYRGEVSRWNGTCFRPYTEFVTDLNRTVKQEFDRNFSVRLIKFKMGEQREDQEAPQLRKVTRNVIGDTIPALESLVSVPSEKTLPCWRDPRPDDPNPANIIPVRNGLLVIDGPEPRLIRHTPRYLGTHCLPFDFDPDAPEPALWLKTLRYQWPDDQQSIDALHEFFGYCCTPRIQYHKMLLLHGPPRCGKGTTRQVLTALVGVNNVASTSAISLSGPFGLQPLLGRYVAFMGDARIGDTHDSAVMMDRILRLAGGDPLDVNVKGKPPLEQVEMPTKLVIFSNEVPNFRDSSGAITRRYLILSMNSEVPEPKQETDLADSIIKAEMSGILNLALAGLKRLRERGRFVQPESSEHLLTMAEDMASPVKMFFHHMATTNQWRYDPDAWIKVEDAFNSWRFWAGTKGYQAGNEGSFGRNLHAAFPRVKRRRPRDPETVNRPYWYEGIGLTTPKPEPEPEPEPEKKQQDLPDKGGIGPGK